jgi:hypothetical protein
MSLELGQTLPWEGSSKVAASHIPRATPPSKMLLGILKAATNRIQQLSSRVMCLCTPRTMPVLEVISHPPLPIPRVLSPRPEFLE